MVLQLLKGKENIWETSSPTGVSAEYGAEVSILR